MPTLVGEFEKLAIAGHVGHTGRPADGTEFSELASCQFSFCRVRHQLVEQFEVREIEIAHIPDRADKLEQTLLTVGEIHHAVERLYNNIGPLEVTPERITSLVARTVLDGVVENIDQFHVCPGYGSTHVWTVKNYIPHPSRVMERCSSHPERRSGERRR